MECFSLAASSIFALKKAGTSGRNVGKVFNPVLKLVFEHYPFSCELLLCFMCGVVWPARPNFHLDEFFCRGNKS